MSSDLHSGEYLLMCCKGEGGAAEHGSLKLFSSSLMPILVEAGLTYQVVPCIHSGCMCC